MPPSAEDRISDILLGIEKIQRLTSGMTVAQFADDELVRAATERFLEIVCEASRRLPDSVKSTATTIDWRRMNNFANLLRHAYHATAVDAVWDVVENHLPPLKAFMQSVAQK